MPTEEFESFVNSEECKTTTVAKFRVLRLRALLIQKSVKPSGLLDGYKRRLRALLIQKSVKLRRTAPSRI